MKNPLLRSLLLLALPLALIGTVRAETAEGRVCLPAKEIRELVDKAEIVPSAKAIASAKAARPGEVVKARLCRQDGRLFYLVTMLAKDGKIRILEVDGRSGSLVEHH
jgi:uncharacterized membrane protein YkoI